MKNLIPIIVIICGLLTIQSNTIAQWETQQSGVSVDLLDVCFVDSANGWIIGDSLTILATNDGGSTWIRQTPPIDSGGASNIQFINNKQGYIVGGNGLILFTFNGGQTWLQYPDTLDYDFTDICFIDEQNGWITGSKLTDSLGTGVILRTDDSGKTWQTQLKIVSDQLFGGLTLFTEIEMLNDSVGWALGGSYSDNFDSAILYYTENSGNDWNDIGMIYSNPAYILKIASKDTLWSSPGFHISNNGGMDWEPRGPNDITVWRIAPTSGLSGWAFIRNNVSNNVGIFYTSDGGETWSEDIIFSGSPFITDIVNIRREHLWIVGLNGMIMRKKIFTTSIKLDEDQLESFRIETNYPNPFNPSTTIKYTVPDVSDVSLTIYDMMGREIRTFENNGISAGQYSTLWDGTNNNGVRVSSGIYIYRFRAVSLSGDAKVFEKSNKLMMLK